MEILKELGRIVLLAAISYLLTDTIISQLVDAATVNYALDPFAKLQITLFLTTVFKSVDRWLHESGIAEKGLTRF